MSLNNSGMFSRRSFLRAALFLVIASLGLFDAPVVFAQRVRPPVERRPGPGAPPVATAAAPQRNSSKVAKPPGDAMDYSVVGARVWLARAVDSTSFRIANIHDTGVTIVREGTAAVTIPYTAGYCRDAKRVPGRGPAIWTIELQPILQWDTENTAEMFCDSWNRLVFASLSEGVDEGVAPGGNASLMTTGMARAVIRELIPKRHLVAYEVGGVDTASEVQRPESVEAGAHARWPVDVAVPLRVGHGLRYRNAGAGP